MLNLLDSKAALACGDNWFGLLTAVAADAPADVPPPSPLARVSCPLQPSHARALSCTRWSRAFWSGPSAAASSVECGTLSRRSTRPSTGGAQNRGTRAPPRPMSKPRRHCPPKEKAAAPAVLCYQQHLRHPHLLRRLICRRHRRRRWRRRRQPILLCPRRLCQEL